MNILNYGDGFVSAAISELPMAEREQVLTALSDPNLSQVFVYLRRRHHELYLSLSAMENTTKENLEFYRTQMFSSISLLEALHDHGAQVLSPEGHPLLRSQTAEEDYKENATDGNAEI